ncbi:MAG: LamG domain-containing protein, partial [Planctomycetales bacterium]|nr:LamG domain-containing protein [Planctomycetales bacterium]
LQLAAFTTDQFGDPIAAPSGLSWAVTSGGGSVTQDGLYTAPGTAGVAVVEVTAPSGSATAEVQILEPVAWYRADESFGTTLNDSSANNNDATIVGAASWTSGVAGNALALTGGHVNLPTGVVSGLEDITLATWFYLDSKSTWSRIFDFGSGTATNMFLTPAAGSTQGPLRFAITTAAGGGEQQINGPTLSTGQWYHVAITLEGGVGTMYLNGAQVAVNSSITLNPADLGTTTQNYLGDSQYVNDPALLGRIDDFQIYSQALSADLIQQMAGASSLSAATAFVHLASLPTVIVDTATLVPGDSVNGATLAGVALAWEPEGDASLAEEVEAGPVDDASETQLSSDLSAATTTAGRIGASPGEAPRRAGAVGRRAMFEQTVDEEVSTQLSAELRLDAIDAAFARSRSAVRRRTRFGEDEA